MGSPKPRHLFPARSVLPVMAGMEVVPPVLPPTETAVLAESRVKGSKLAWATVRLAVARTAPIEMSNVVREDERFMDGCLLESLESAWSIECTGYCI